MEFEVKLVGSIESCFVSLPLVLIQTLESTRSGRLPELLTVELRSNNESWFVAWSGATSSSTAIEVAQQFAECMDLPDHITVQVRVVSNVPKATLVTIEPHSEDDWEVLELNSEHAEAAILKQVRIVHEAMRFPLWLHGHTIITFLVVSTFPKKGVVQLVPGTEVAVPPKRREKKIDPHDVQSNEEHLTEKVLLRIQEPDKRFIHKTVLNGVELGIGLTSVAFVHPKTAQKFSFHSYQRVVLLPKLSQTNNEALSTKTSDEESKGVLTDNKGSRQAIFHLLLSDSVAIGHVMVAHTILRYLRTGVHSWVYLKACDMNIKKNIPPITVSPCYFRMLLKDEAPEKNGLEALKRSNKTKNILTASTYLGAAELLTHSKVLAALSDESSCKENEEAVCQSDNRKGLCTLLHMWFLAQFDAIASNAGISMNSLILGSETLLYFEVKCHNFGICQKIHRLPNDFLENQSREKPPEILYILKISEENQNGWKNNAYDVAFNERSPRNDHIEGLKLLENINLGDPVVIYMDRVKTSDRSFSSNVSSLSWMGTTAADVVNRMMALLSPASCKWFSTYDLPLPGHVLIYGPPGSGKTMLARAVAKSLEEERDVLAHIVSVSCSRLAIEKATAIRQALSNYISEALVNAPSVVIFDDLDSIISSSSDPEVSQPSTSVVALTTFLTDIVDEYADKGKSSCGIGPIGFLATVQSLDKIPQLLRSSGRFDYHVQLPAPAAAERQAILKHEIQKRSLQCSDDILPDVASKCDGYDAYDLEILVDRTVHAAVSRFVSSSSSCEEHEEPTLIRDDFDRAIQDFVPVAMRDITKPAPEGGRAGWDDVGGLSDIQKAIKEMIELPAKFPHIFTQAPLRLRSNVLLYGPPGCGKTHVVGAAAAACSLQFISVKGPELLNKYIGASEQAVRDIFSKAAAAAPCLLFFDEFDSIAPKRGHDNTGVTDRVVNQFLTELDGVEVLTGVFVFAATRPDLLDAALLRPGRLDRLLFCDFPSRSERLDILTVLSRKLPLASDADLDAIAYMTEGFSGADLQALLSDAQLAAVHELLDSAKEDKSLRKPIITDALLKSIASKARPSVSDTEKRRLYDIYSQFLNAKRSVAAQSRDAKGKRATLA